MRNGVIILCLLFIGCSGSKDLPDLSPQQGSRASKLADKQIDDNIIEISAPIVKKSFVNKAGKTLDFKEYYVQRSIQDYFIKFCESSVSKEEIDKALDAIDSPIKTLKMQVEIIDGEWDICPGDQVHMQSRIGDYIVIHKIL